jgi:hypothetical protein
MPIDELCGGASTSGEAKQIDLPQAELVDQLVTILDHVLRLQVVRWQIAAAPAAPAKVEEHHVMVTRQWFEPRQQVAVPNVRSTVQHNQ